MAKVTNGSFSAAIRTGVVARVLRSCRRGVGFAIARVDAFTLRVRRTDDPLADPGGAVGDRPLEHRLRGDP